MSRMSTELGRVLGRRYRIIAPIGMGASAQVFLADDVRLRRRVAVKMLHAALADDAEFLRRFHAEAQAAAALNHPNVLSVFDWGDDDDQQPYLVSEFLAGGSLRAMLDLDRLLSPAQALRIGLEATRALDYAHHRGLVHRDIKPANLLFGDEGRLRIADFGLARALAEAAWTEPQGAVLGTARYASPEQAQGESLTDKSDIYSLALVLVEAVTGQVPFAADTTIGTLMARVNRPLEVPDELGPLVPVLTRAGRADPAERLDAHGLGVALMAAAGQLDRPDRLHLAGAVASAPTDVDHDADPTLLPPSRHADGGDAVPEPAPRAQVDDTPGAVAAAEAWAIAAQAQDQPVAEPTARTGVGDGDGDGDGDDAALTTPIAPVDPEAWASPPVAFVPAPPPPGADPPDGYEDGDFDAEYDPDGEYEYEYDDYEEQPRRRGWIVAVLLVLLLGGAVFGGLALVGASEEGLKRVPSLSGLQLATAKARVAKYGWKVTEEHTRKDGTRPDQVLLTTPGVGTRLRRGDKINFLVSDGPTLVAVPAGLRNQPLAGVETLYGAIGLKVSSTRQFDEDVAKDNVIDMAPGTPAQLPKGSTVAVVVSDGPMPRVIPQGLVGISYADAADQLEKLRLNPVRVDQYNDDKNVKAGQVFDMDPKADATVPRDSDVTLYVSAGPTPVAVPSTLGLSQAQAVAALGNLGFFVNVTTEFSDTVGNGTAIGTRPGAGSTVQPGATITLVVSKGQDLVVVPQVFGTNTAQEAAVRLAAAGLTPGTVSGPATGKPASTTPPANSQVKRGTVVNIVLG